MQDFLYAMEKLIASTDFYESLEQGSLEKSICGEELSGQMERQKIKATPIINRKNFLHREPARQLVVY